MKNKKKPSNPWESVTLRDLMPAPLNGGISQAEEVAMQNPAPQAPTEIAAPETTPVPAGRASLPPQFSPNDLRAKYLDQIRQSQERMQRSSENTYMSPEEYQQYSNTVRGITPGKVGINPETGAYEQLPDVQDPNNPIAQQEMGVKQLQDLLTSGVEHRPNQVDLSPLASLVDTWTGSKFAQSYKRPEDYGALMDKLVAYSDKIQDARKDVASKVQEGVRGLKSGSIYEQLMNRLGQENMAGIVPQAPQRPRAATASKAPQVNNPMEMIWRQFDKKAGKSIDQLQAANQSIAQLEQGTKVSYEMLKRTMLQAVGEVRPSDRDVQGIGGDPGLLNRLEQAWEWARGNGTLTNLNQEQMAEVVKAGALISIKRFKELAERHAKSAKVYQPSLSSMSNEEIQRALWDRAGYVPGDLDQIVKNADRVSKTKKVRAAEEKKKSSGGDVDQKKKQLQDLMESNKKIEETLRKSGMLK